VKEGDDNELTSMISFLSLCHLPCFTAVHKEQALFIVEQERNQQELFTLQKRIPSFALSFSAALGTLSCCPFDIAPSNHQLCPKPPFHHSPDQTLETYQFWHKTKTALLPVFINNFEIVFIHFDRSKKSNKSLRV